MRLMEILAALAKRTALRPLSNLCEQQKQVSTARLEQMLEPIGDDLAGYALVLRGEFDRLCAENRALKADAKRYRFARAYENDCWMLNALQRVGESDLDAEIDAAIVGTRHE